jgi:phage protein U
VAKIGNLGKSIVFSTSDKKIFTFKNFKQTVSGRWAEHERILKKPRAEFLGAGLRKITFDINLNVQLGIKPRKILKTMEKMVESGTAEKLVIGGHKVGKNKWRITSISETWNVIMNKGELVQASVSLTLEEYL